MNAEPPGFDRAALYAALREWELSITSLSYLPLGAGSHHCLARDAAGTRWFVTMDVLEWKLDGMFGPTFDPWVTPDLESGLDGLDRAFRTAVALRDGGLDCAHAPTTRPDGAVVAGLGDDYAVSVFPLVDGASHSMTDVDRPRLLEAVGRLHACTDVVPADLPRRDSLTVPIRSQFFESLDTLHSSWNHGPFGQSARRLLRENQSLLRDIWHRCDELADEVRGSRVEWVIARPVALRECAVGQQWRAHTDRLGLCRPGTARARLGQALGGLAEPKTREDWAAYTAAGVGAGVNPSAVDLYWHIGLLWGLCVSTETLRFPARRRSRHPTHVDNAPVALERGRRGV